MEIHWLINCRIIHVRETRGGRNMLQVGDILQGGLAEKEKADEIEKEVAKTQERRGNSAVGEF